MQERKERKEEKVAKWVSQQVVPLVEKKLSYFFVSAFEMTKFLVEYSSLCQLRRLSLRWNEPGLGLKGRGQISGSR